jgi:hypothetical protein
MKKRQQQLLQKLFCVRWLAKNCNCRYGCQASQFDIADTLFEDSLYLVNAITQDGVFAQFIDLTDPQCCNASDNDEINS